MMTHQDDESLLSEEAAAVNPVELRNRRWRAARQAAFGLGLAAVACVLVARPVLRHSGAASSAPSFRVAGAVELAETSCSAAGESCNATRCCSGPGLQCYQKDAYFAECRASCIPGPDPRSADKGPWSCKKLGKRTEGEPPKCSHTGEDCTKSQCCAESGMQCYQKSNGWATCKADCVKGLDLTDVDDTPWSCQELGPRTPDVAPWVWTQCAATNGDCSKSQCCNTPGMQCYMKDQFYGTCRASCDPNDLETQSWSCDARGTRLPQPAPKPDPATQKIANWVADKCTKAGQDCRKSTCCAESDHQCFEKNASFAMCKASCTPGPDLYDVDNKEWSCKAIGPRTPGAKALQPWEQQKHVSPWVAKTCAAEYEENCAEVKCCSKVGDQCYEKNDGWASCQPSCTPGPKEGDESCGNWTCRELGTRRHRAYPSLYCFSVMQPFGYEPPLMKAQMNTSHGIWACDKYSVYSTKEFVVGTGPDGEVKTVTFVPAVVGSSKDHTAANAELFMHVWDSVKAQGIWRQTDWTIKVDPDAVLLPTRLRRHLDAFTGQKGYVVNCAKPYMPEGPMMFGALEAFTRSAMEAYYEKAHDCAASLPWNIWGEDLFMGKCLEKIGVSRLNDFTIYSDGVCRGVDCTDPDAAAFHPKKDIGSWMGCLEQTKHPHPRFTTDAPQWFKDYMKTYTR